MNNRYLYRAKALSDGTWKYGSFLEWINPESKEVVSQIIFPDYELGAVSYSIIDKSTLGQCTGLKDCKGNLIFEHDWFICHAHNKKMPYCVFWSDDEDTAAYPQFDTSGCGFSPDGIEIVGNKHDKPKWTKDDKEELQKIKAVTT